jgi:GABA(A) receptor-associated protein
MSKTDASILLTKYTDRIPIICNLAPNSSLPLLDKRKFLVQRDFTFGQFIYIIRKRLKLTSSVSLFGFVGDNIMPPVSALLSEIYEKHKSPDLFLYVIINNESVFGDI